jgi:CheY-like chemotaxis protein
MAHDDPILLADDDENDIFLMRRAFGDAGLANPLRIARNGQEAIGYLNAEGAYADREKHPWPCLLLLDLKMPLVDGFEVLAWLQRRRRPKSLRVVIVTSSKHDTDLLRAFELGADSYWVKSPNYHELVEFVRELHKQINDTPSIPEWLRLRRRAGRF